MANTFALILVLVTLVTGIIWTLDKFLWAPRRLQKAADTLHVRVESVEAKQLEQTAPRPAWIENTAPIFPVLALVLVLRSFVYEPFQIPSGSMMPTLLVGDFILVEKFTYGLKDPIFRKQLVNTGEPERGDVVVFKYPPQPQVDYIKRVVGLPGDTVRYQNDKRICIQPKGALECRPVAISNVQESDFTQVKIRLLQATEQLGKRAHDILINPYMPNYVDQYQPTPGKGEWVVPEDHYFVLGDNRDNSKDGRFFGFVPKENLVGKAVAIWISFEFSDEESWLPSWIPVNVRFNRIGAIN
ncbi:MAG: signal peptidase I [Enterovibrio sp.]